MESCKQEQQAAADSAQETDDRALLTHHENRLTHCKRIVVKVGSSLVTNQGEGLDLKALGNWARQIAALNADGHEVVLVSSGAIAGRACNGLRLEHPPSARYMNCRPPPQSARWDWCRPTKAAFAHTICMPRKCCSPMPIWPIASAI